MIIIKPLFYQPCSICPNAIVCHSLSINAHFTRLFVEHDCYEPAGCRKWLPDHCLLDVLRLQVQAAREPIVVFILPFLGFLC